MADEYTYFRLSGDSHTLAETVARAKTRIDKVRDGLCETFNAFSLATHKDADGTITITEMIFDSDSAPHGWVEAGKPMNQGKFLRLLPPADSPLRQQFAMAADIMTHWTPKARLESIFGIDEMPMRALGPGKYSFAFVRRATVYSDNFSGWEPQPAQGYGRLTQPISFIGGSNGACRVSDPLQAMLIEDDYYLRVPNDEDGRPRFIPPDAAVVGFDEMLALDARAHAAQQAARNSRRPPAP